MFSRKAGWPSPPEDPCDYLDNTIPPMDENLFYKYYSDLASAARILNHTVVFQTPHIGHKGPKRAHEASTQKVKNV